jgi:hypothetical protein
MSLTGKVYNRPFLYRDTVKKCTCCNAGGKLNGEERFPRASITVEGTERTSLNQSVHNPGSGFHLDGIQPRKPERLRFIPVAILG